MAIPMYGNYYPNQFQQQPMQQQVPQQQPQTSPQIQNGGFIPVSSEEVARNYPVAPGNSVTFKNENAPYVYTKTMGFSQLDRPIFERYKLIREEDEVQEAPKQEPKVEVTEIDKLRREIDDIWNEIDVLKEQRKKQHNQKRKNSEDN